MITYNGVGTVNNRSILDGHDNPRIFFEQAARFAEDMGYCDTVEFDDEEGCVYLDGDSFTYDDLESAIADNAFAFMDSVEDADLRDFVNRCRQLLFWEGTPEFSDEECYELLTAGQQAAYRETLSDCGVSF